MAVENLYISGLAADDPGSLSGAANANGSTSGTWTTNTDNSSWEGRFELDNPTNAPTASQTITVTVRARHDSGNNPTIDSVAIRNGTTQRGIDSTGWSVSSLTGQDIVASVSCTGLTGDGADLSLVIVTTAVGGSPGNRSAVQIDYVKVDVDTQAATVHDGAAALSGTGSATIAGAVVKDGSASLSSAASLSAAGDVFKDGSASLTGVGSATVAGTVIRDGSAALAATGALTAAGEADVFGIAALSAVGSMAVSGDVVSAVQEGSAALSATGGASVSGTVIRDGATSLSAAASTTASGLVIREGVVPLSAVGSVTVSGTVTYIGAASLSAVGSLSVVVPSASPSVFFVDFGRWLRKGERFVFLVGGRSKGIGYTDWERVSGNIWFADQAEVESACWPTLLANSGDDAAALKSKVHAAVQAAGVPSKIREP